MNFKIEIHVAPTELQTLLSVYFYKHFAPPGLRSVFNSVRSDMFIE